MAKRRKTRNQKEQATRKVRQPATSAARSPQSSSQAKAVPVEPTAQEAITAPEQVQHRQRMRAMRISVAIFGVLLVVQLSLWSLERLDILTLELAPF